jgi:hypothetical protein
VPPVPTPSGQAGGFSGVVVERLIRPVARRPDVVLVAIVLIAVALNLWETRGQTFHSDEWGRLIGYTGRGVETLVRGYSGHLVALHAMLYKGLLEAFGAGSYLSFRIVHALLVGANALLFYTLARARADAWPCVGATVVLLCLGSAFSVLATPYGTVILLPVFFGLAALVCLQRLPRRPGNVGACLLLILAVASHSVGLAFLAGAAVVLVQQSGRAVMRWLWVILVPGALYVAWWVWARRSGPQLPDPVQLQSLTDVPWSVVEVGAAGLAAISGLFGGSGLEAGPQGQVRLEKFHLTAGYLLLGLIAVATIWRVLRGPPIAREIWVPVALALSFWVLVAIVVAGGPIPFVGGERSPSEGRYLYPSAVFLLLILLELMRGIRPRPWLICVGVGVLLVSVVPNALNLHHQAVQIRHLAGIERSRLGALELLRDEAPAASIPTLTFQAGVINVGPAFTPATRYFAAVDRYGSPADSAAEIGAAEEGPRRAFDQVLLEGDDLALQELPPSRGRRCRPASESGGDMGRPVRVPASGLEIRPRGSSLELSVLVRRFATGFQRLSVPFGRGPWLLRARPSRRGPPWRALVHGGAVCARD